MASDDNFDLFGWISLSRAKNDDVRVGLGEQSNVLTGTVPFSVTVESIFQAVRWNLGKATIVLKVLMYGLFVNLAGLLNDLSEFLPIDYTSSFPPNYVLCMEIFLE